MATKRQAPSDGEVQRFSKRSKPSAYQHQQRPAHHGKKSFKKAHPVNELKSTVRNLRRLLDRQDDLPANVRIEKERALQTAERDLREAEKAKKRSDIIGKYHKIRFFERQKAERRLKRARREVKEAEEKGEGEGGDEGLAKLKRKVDDAEVDLNYTMYFPLVKDYVSLWPARRNKDDESENDGKDAERQGDSDMLGVVKKCMKGGTLKDLREGRLTDQGEQIQEEKESVSRPARRKQSGKAGSSKHAQDGEGEESGEDETGGGFFE